jgi:ATP-binding cassette subfamily B (MDR/TAP) protein 1
VGCTLPVYGVFFSKYLSVTTYPKAYVEYVLKKDYHDYVYTEVNKWTFCTMAMGGIHLTFGLMSKYCFGTLAENVTLEFRKDIYAAILRKHIGWFDKQENSPAILTSLMADDTAEINGVAADSINVNVEGLFSILVGSGIAFYYCWQIALVTFIAIPVMGFGLYLQAAFMKQGREKTKGGQGNADLLAGDAILNYKTIASFANEEAIVAKFEEYIVE